MLAFANRNLKVFFRDKTAVFFSLLAVFIVLGLYVTTSIMILIGSDVVFFLLAILIISKKKK